MITKFSPWECAYCGTQNTYEQRGFCGHGTTNGCGAGRQDADTMRDLVGIIDGELIYSDDPRLPDLIEDAAYCSIIRIGM